MKRVLLSLLVIAFLQSCFAQSDIDPLRQWSVYRGPQSSGFIDNVGLPENWNIENGENIKWKVEIPGLALSQSSRKHLGSACSQFQGESTGPGEGRDLDQV